MAGDKATNVVGTVFAAGSLVSVAGALAIMMTGQKSS